MELDEFRAHCATTGAAFLELNDIDESIISAGAMQQPVTTSNCSTQQEIGPGPTIVKSSGEPDLSAGSSMTDPAAKSLKGIRPIVPVGPANLAKGVIDRPKRYTILLEDATNHSGES